MIEYPHAKGLMKAPTYSHVVTATGAKTIYISGQVAIDESGTAVGIDDLGAQTAQVMRNLGLALAAAGASFADLVRTTTYVVNYTPEHRGVIADAKAPFMTGITPPASTLLGVQALARPEWLIEIEGVAVV